MSRFLILTAALLVTAGGALASSLTQPQILQALDDLEGCIRTMCLPANDPAMSLSWARDLRSKLSQQPNALDQWVIARLDPVIALLAQKQIKPALDRTQAAVAGLLRPQVLKSLGGLEVCIRTMCLPAGDAAMGVSETRKILKDLARYHGPFPSWLTQRLGAIVLLLEQKKIREGLDQLHATIRELPQP